MYRITNLLLLLIITLFILPTSAIMHAGGSPQNSDNDGGSSSDNTDEMDDGSTDNTDESGNDSSMDSSMENNDDESDTRSMEKFHGAPGENLISCCTSHGITNLTGAIENGWASEKNNYHGEVLTKENYVGFGHYTQMVWGHTKEVGCAIAHDTTNAGGMYYLDCRYSPPGNYFGQKPY